MNTPKQSPALFCTPTFQFYPAAFGDFRRQTKNLYAMYKYVTRAIKQPGTTNVKWYIQAAKQDPITLDKLADRIEKRSTVSKADVKAVLSALEYELIQGITEGQTIRLGDIGTFYTSLKSEGVATQKEAWESGPQLIKHVTCCFMRSNTISAALDPKKLNFGPDSVEEYKKEQYRAAHPEEFQN